MRTHADRLAVRFLRSSMSRPFVGWFAGRHGIALPSDHNYHSFQAFFCRKLPRDGLDITPDHLISPCDGYLSAVPISEDNRFLIKGTYYSLWDLLRNSEIARRFSGGVCLIIRLEARDYHRYCCLDDGYIGKQHLLDGELHSVQSAACQRVRVYSRNRRAWNTYQTDHFGQIVQIEVGALIVGGIVNHYENHRVLKGEEMGYFDLAGSTIVLLFQQDRIEVLQEIEAALARGEEVRVSYGEMIGRSAVPQTAPSNWVTLK